LFPSSAAFFAQELVPGLAFDAAIGFVLGTIAQLLLGWPLYRSAWQSLYHSHAANMDLLLSLSTLTAYFYSLVVVSLAIAAGAPAPVSFFETPAVLLMLVMLGRYLESAAKGQTSRILVSLADLQPPSATLLLPQPRLSLPSPGISVSVGEPPLYEEQDIDADLVQRGDLLKVPAARSLLAHSSYQVLPGAKIPTDGAVEWGSSAVDESSLTGESIPVAKQPGALVYGGTFNATGVLSC
jgi:Cu+-exporting ATPase